MSGTIYLSLWSLYALPLLDTIGKWNHFQIWQITKSKKIYKTFFFSSLTTWFGCNSVTDMKNSVEGKIWVTIFGIFWCKTGNKEPSSPIKLGLFCQILFFSENFLRTNCRYNNFTSGWAPVWLWWSLISEWNIDQNFAVVFILTRPDPLRRCMNRTKSGCRTGWNRVRRNNGRVNIWNCFCLAYGIVVVLK